MKAFQGIALLALVNFFTMFVFNGCSDDDNNNPPDLQVNSCEGCHTNYDHLRAIADPDTSTGGGGCGGDAPHIEPYDRVHLGGAGYDVFAASTHGEMECIDCHNGQDGTDDKSLAHSGDFISHPSDHSAEKCGTCHADVVARTTNSLHEQGWGQKSMVVLRSGLTDFSQLSALMQDGYNTNCAKCHASCGDCHVNRPKAGGGGLYRGHQFATSPDTRDICVACHVSRGGHAFFGVGSGTVPDVHQSDQNFECTSCHTGNEVHGDGTSYDQRYKMAMLPKCENCHSNLAAANTYHAMHIDDINCQVCHSQDYNNCGSCHIGGDGARIPAYMGFKIGRNPIPETKPYKFATLRRSLMAPDSWALYGTSDLPNFAVRPTYKYTTPHNIQRWTARTTVDAGKPCYDNCHIITEGNVTRNEELYLFKSELESWEIPASDSIVVDGYLPDSW